MKVSTAVKSASGGYDYVDVPALFRAVDTRIFGDNLSMVTVIFIICLIFSWLALAKHSWVGNSTPSAAMKKHRVCPECRWSGQRLVLMRRPGLGSGGWNLSGGPGEQQGDPEAGVGYELIAIAMVVIGGTSLSGGRGGMGLTLLGVLTIGYLDKILSINAVPEAGG